MSESYQDPIVHQPYKDPFTALPLASMDRAFISEYNQLPLLNGPILVFLSNGKSLIRMGWC
jgi:hypothetical protein